MSEDVRRIRCGGCGAVRETRGFEPESLAGVAADHLRACEKRYLGHPAFGFEPRWQKYPLYDMGQSFFEIEVSWTTHEWGYPFDLEAA